MPETEVHPVLGTITKIKIKLNVGTGNLTFDPPLDPQGEVPIGGTNGASFVLEDDAGNSLTPEYAAFVAVTDVGELVPEPPTLACGLDGRVFPLQVGPTPFKPTFGTNSAHSKVRVAITVLYPLEGLNANQAAQSVVIIDW